MQNGDALSDVQVASGFMTTRWSVVARATAATAESHAAIEDLCRAYWFPVYTYVRKQGFDAADAEDATQDFFAELMRSPFLRRADPDQGRFRSYLLTAVRRRLFNRRARSTTLKRGGGTEVISIDEALVEKRFQEANDPGLDPAQAYELGWALTVLQRARERLVAEQTEKGQLMEFERFEPFLAMRPAEGDYVALAAELNSTTNRVAVGIHRLGRRYRDLLREEVAQTVNSPGEIDEELAHLSRVLSR